MARTKLDGDLINAVGKNVLHGSTIDDGANRLQVTGGAKTDKITVTTPNVPATATAVGVKGEIAYDANFVYICVATNTWKRAALATW